MASVRQSAFMLLQREGCGHPSAPDTAFIVTPRYLRRTMSSIEQIRKGFIDPPPAANVRSARRASVAIVLAGDCDAPSVCFVERVHRAGDRWSGDVAFPGGWASHGDESLRATAMREAHEEVGLALDDAPPRRRRGADADLTLRFRLGGSSARACSTSASPAPRFTRTNARSTRAFWVPAAHLYHPDNHTVVYWSRSGPPRPRPAIAFGGRVIWGLTYRMLVRFSNLATGGRSPLEADPD